MIVHQIAANETYRDVDKLIYRIIHNFIKRYGGEFDDLLSMCNEAFVEAYITHNHTLASFTTWLVPKLWHKMLREKHKEIVRCRRIPAVEHIDEITIPQRSHQESQMPGFIERLSKDGKVLVSCALVCWIEQQHEGVPLLSAIKAACRETGMTHRAIAEARIELAGALR